MTSCILSYCCAMIILLSGSDTSANFVYEADLYDGSPCKTEYREPGICKKLMVCPPKLADVRDGVRSGDAAGRCGFVGDIEIVCCSEDHKRTIGPRPADIACSKNMKIAGDVLGTIYGYDYCLLGGGCGTTEGEFPFMAALGYVENDGEESGPISYDCGGSLVSLEHILTAAHCVSNNWSRIPRWVRLGYTGIKSTNVQVIPVGRTIPHPRYRRGQMYHDVAIVKLQRPIEITSKLFPICLDTMSPWDVSRHPDSPLTTMGFGVMSPDDDSKPKNLMKSPALCVVETTKCNESYRNFAWVPRGIDDTMICAMDINTTRSADTCQGDSGGPVLQVINKVPKLLAVTSFGKGCRSNEPSVYTSVLAYIDWIESTVWPGETLLYKKSRSNIDEYIFFKVYRRSNGDLAAALREN